MPLLQPIGILLRLQLLYYSGTEHFKVLLHNNILTAEECWFDYPARFFRIGRYCIYCLAR